MPTTTITTIRTVAIPATDQDRSVAFFVDKLGFEKRMDAELAEGFRWIEVAPPGSDVSVAIVTASGELPAGIDTGIRFVTTDAEAEHASMERAGRRRGRGAAVAGGAADVLLPRPRRQHLLPGRARLLGTLGVAAVPNAARPRGPTEERA